MLNDASAKRARILILEIDNLTIAGACHECLLSLSKKLQQAFVSIHSSETSDSPEECFNEVRKEISHLSVSQLVLLVLMASSKAIEFSEVLREEGIFEKSGQPPCSYTLIHGKGNRCDKGNCGNA